MTMPAIDELRRLFRYNAWANARILDAVARVPEPDFVRDLGSSYPSIRDTLVHAMSAEWAWLERWDGRSPGGPPAGWPEASLPELRRLWAGVEGGWRARLESATEADLDGVVAYRNTAGIPYRSRLGDVLRHVVNHSSYHRGQVVTMLRQVGAAAPSTDLVEYYRTGDAEAGAMRDDGPR